MGSTKIKNNRFDLPSVLAYLVVITIPLSALTTGGLGENYKYTLAGTLAFYEVPILVLLPFAAFGIASSGFRLKLRTIDVLLIALLLISLVPIVVNWGSLYQEAREYRARLLSPFIAYMVYRICIRNFYQFRLSLLLVLVPVIFQALMVIKYYLEFGRRFEPGLDMMMLPVILSFYLVFGLAVLFYLKSDRWRKPFWKVIRIGSICILLAALIMTAGRMATFGLMFGILIVPIVRKASFQRIFIIGFLSIIAITSFLTMVIPEEDLVVETQSTYDERWSVGRLISMEQAVEDIGNRLLFWKLLMRQGMESPLYGLGLTAFDSIELRSGATHAHSLFVGVFIAAGLLGFTIISAIFVTNFRALFFVSSVTSDRDILAMSKILFVSFLVLTLISFTNDFKGGLESVFLLFLAMTSKLCELQQESESVTTKIVAAPNEHLNSTRILARKKRHFK